MTDRMPAGKSPFDSADLVITGLYAIAIAYLISRHAMWSDEAQQWLIAKSSHSLAELYRNRSYERHPLAWYLLLYPFAHLSNDIDLIKIPNFLASIAFVYLTCRHFLRGLYEKLAFALGSHVLVFYAILPRPYMTACLLEIAALILILERRDPRLVFLCIALSASLHALWTVISGGLFLYYLSLRWKDETSHPSRGFWMGAGLTLSWFALTAFQMMIPGDSADYSDISLNGAAMDWTRMFTDILTFGFPSSVGSPVFAVLYGGVAYCAIRGGWRIAGFLAVTTLPLILILILGTMRSGSVPWHTGAIYLAMLMTLFLVRARAGLDPALRTRAGWVLAALLAVQLLDAKQTLNTVLAKPFSEGRYAAAFIQSYCPARCPIVAWSDIEGAILSAYLGGEPVYYANRREFGTFIKFDRFRNHPVTYEEMVETARGMNNSLIVLPTELAATQLSAFGLTRLAGFTGSFFENDDFFIYGFAANRKDGGVTSFR